MIMSIHWCSRDSIQLTFLNIFLFSYLSVFEKINIQILYKIKNLPWKSLYDFATRDKITGRIRAGIRWGHTNVLPLINQVHETRLRAGIWQSLRILLYASFLCSMPPPPPKNWNTASNPDFYLKNGYYFKLFQKSNTKLISIAIL